MEQFAGRLAVITGGGTGMGRELARQLTAEGCHVGMCDISVEDMAETVQLCRKDTPEGPQISAFRADVSVESQMLAFRDALTPPMNVQQTSVTLGTHVSSSRQQARNEGPPTAARVTRKPSGTRKSPSCGSAARRQRMRGPGIRRPGSAMYGCYRPFACVERTPALL